MKQFETSVSLDIPHAYYDNNANQAIAFQTPDANGNLSNVARPIICQHRGRFINRAGVNDSFYSKPSGNNLSNDIYLGSVASQIYNKFILSTDKEPTPEMVIEWSRLITYVDPASQSVICGTEMVLG